MKAPKYIFCCYSYYILEVKYFKGKRSRYFSTFILFPTFEQGASGFDTVWKEPLSSAKENVIKYTFPQVCNVLVTGRMSSWHMQNFTSSSSGCMRSRIETPVQLRKSVLRGEVTCPSHPASQWQSLELKLSYSSNRYYMMPPEECVVFL